jgi:hypothetical protein
MSLSCAYYKELMHNYVYIYICVCVCVCVCVLFGSNKDNIGYVHDNNTCSTSKNIEQPQNTKLKLLIGAKVIQKKILW